MSRPLPRVTSALADGVSARLDELEAAPEGAWLDVYGMATPDVLAARADLVARHGMFTGYLGVYGGATNLGQGWQPDAGAVAGMRLRF